MLGKSVWLALCAVWLGAAATARADAGRRSAFIDGGVRWIGTSSTTPCHAQSPWLARPLFRTLQLPLNLNRICLYTWASAGSAPTQGDVAVLFGSSDAPDLTEDVAAVLESAVFSPEEVALLGGLRNALRAQVGDAGLLPPIAKQPPAARIAVIDSAPDASHGHVVPGASRHGDTLAHLIEDLVCLPGKTKCAAEVTTALAIPGGAGTLSDLAGAIERVVAAWLTGRASAPALTPPQLILNLSVGWEHQPGIADCTASPEGIGPAAHAVVGILQYAAMHGALIIAAAGNDSGGPMPRTGLVCPARFQAMPRLADVKQSLVVAVSGVDYHDRPLTSARPLGIAALAGLGLGGVAWRAIDPVPPPLTGSSVSTAVVSAVSALVWQRQPAWTSAQIAKAVYAGGVDVGPADACPLGLAGCRSHRASVCGALNAAGAAIACAPPPAKPGSSPALPAEISALTAAFATLPATPGVATVTAAPLPHDTVPTLQIQPWLYPMPIAETCPVCCVAAAQLVMQAHDQDLEDPVLVVEYTDGSAQSVALAPPAAPFGPAVLDGGTPYSFALPPPPSATSGPAVAAYLTAVVAPVGAPPYSILEQIYVQP
jgi:hypothetical protein